MTVHRMNYLCMPNPAALYNVCLYLNSTAYLQVQFGGYSTLCVFFHYYRPCKLIVACLNAHVFISCNPFGYLPVCVPGMNPNWRGCDVTSIFSSHSSLTPKAASWWRPGLEMLMTQLHCDGNSREHSNCPLIASTGETLVKHPYEVHPGSMPTSQ